MKDDSKIYCSRCGAEMNSKSRYCMKCGNLNYNHPENKSMKPFIKSNAKGYIVGSGSIINQATGNSLALNIGNNTGKKTLCFLITFGIYILLILLCFFSSISGGFSFESFRYSIFPIMSIHLSLSFLFIYAIELMYMKMNLRWWSSLIPIYNVMILSEKVFGNKWFGLLMLVPIVGIIYSIVLLFELGKKFGYNGYITVFFSFFVILFIGFGTHFFDNIYYTDNSLKNSLEKEYKMKRVFLCFSFILFIFGIGITLYNFNKIDEQMFELKKYYYVYASDRIVYKVKSKIQAKFIDCNGIDELSEGSVYYFYLPHASSQASIFLGSFFDEISAYVKVVRENDNYTYYISLSDGTFGFSETLSSEVSVKTIINYAQLDYERGSSGECEIIYNKDYLK